jgi:phosphoenolpyruvate carboxykinase (ATP)
MGKDVTPTITLSAIEAIAEKTATFVSMGVDGLEYLPFKGFDPDFSDPEYKQQFIARLKDRIAFIQDKNIAKGGYDQLPNECIVSIHNIEVQAEKL